MTQATTIEEVKQQLTQSMEMVKRPEYLDAEVRPYLEAENGAKGNWETRVLQLDGTGAATLEMNLNGERIFGKFFPNDSCPFVYEKLKVLRVAGFGSDERYQIIEPLSFTPEYRMLLTRGVEGSAVSEFIGVDEDTVLSGVEEVARWLAKLHTSPIRFGKPRYLLESSELLSVTRRLAKVVIRRPEYLAQALAMVRQMEKLAEDTVDGILVQSHGQYRLIHVFVGDSSISVVDMDRSRPCDPAYDVVEFIHRLRKTTFKCTGSVEPADAPTRAFLQTYSSAIPDRSYLTNLRFHWARFIFHSLNHEVKDAADENTESEAIVAFCRSEFENVIEGRFGIQEGAFDY
jgi:hypothetical protein